MPGAPLEAATVNWKPRFVAHPGSVDWGPYFEQQFPLYPSELALLTVLGARPIGEGLDRVKRGLVLGEHLAEEQVPMLVVNSAHDRVLPASEGEKLKQGACNAQVELVVFPGRAHGGPSARQYLLKLTGPPTNSQ
jgi:pimeloyl-ACP methyl ester carboxylesterase